MGSVKDLKSKQELDSSLNGSDPIILHFWASWCEASKQMDQVFSHLSTDFPQARFYRVEAEEHPEISEAYSVSAVPYFVFCKGGKTIDTLEGASPSGLANKVAKIVGSTDNASSSAAPASLGLAAGPTVLETVKEFAKHNGSSSHPEPPKTANGLPDSLRTRLHRLVSSHPVFLFMKGTPDQPKCGFSRKAVGILKEEGVRFGSFDVLSDEEVREGMKKFSEWPSFPQLYCRGEFLGGCDIAAAMHESGELKEVFAGSGVSAAEPSGPTARLEKLINASPVMLFMKGAPDEPRCGFSSKVVQALRGEGIGFGSFDILGDEEVRQGLKAYSNWPTFPQLYYKGELIGGCDIVLELAASGELKSTLSE